VYQYQFCLVVCNIVGKSSTYQLDQFAQYTKREKVGFRTKKKKERIHIKHFTLPNKRKRDKNYEQVKDLICECKTIND